MKPGKGTKHRQQRSNSRRSSLFCSRLEGMISEAIVDCHNDTEQAMGLFNMIEEKLRLPFPTIVLGIQVTVEKIDLNEAGEIVAVCARGPERQRIPLWISPCLLCDWKVRSGSKRIGSGRGGDRQARGCSTREPADGIGRSQAPMKRSASSTGESFTRDLGDSLCRHHGGYPPISEERRTIRC
jgi:hypothetical protein